VSLENEDQELELWKQAKGSYLLIRKGQRAAFEIKHKKDGKIVYDIEGKSFTAYVSEKEDHSLAISLAGKQFNFRRYDRLTDSELILEESEMSGADQLKSPMPGKVILLQVKEGESVKKGDVLLVVEAMKMENNIVASRDATVEKVYVAQDEMVERNMPLVKLA